MSVYCQQCGMQLGESARFCSRCGTPTQIRAEAAQSSQATPPAPAVPSAPASYAAVIPAADSASNLRGQIQTLGILWVIYSALRLMFWASGLAFRDGMMRMSVYGWPGSMSYPLMHWMGGMFLFSRILSLATAVVGIWAGVALLRRHAEGRSVAMVAACLALLSFPLGTALGIYTQVVLLRKGAAESYERLSVPVS